MLSHAPLSAIIFVVTRHADPGVAYNRAALSRSYFFLSSWRWYEYAGLLMPLLLLGIAGTSRRAPWPARALAITQGSCWMMLADTPARIASKVGPVVQAGKSIGLRMSVVTRPTRADRTQARAASSSRTGTMTSSTSRRTPPGA